MKPLQHESVIPLYHQLMERLKDSIEKGHWTPGDKIPSENQLMDQFGVSRNTAKKAIEELVQEGILYRIQDGVELKLFILENIKKMIC